MTYAPRTLQRQVTRSLIEQVESAIKSPMVKCAKIENTCPAVGCWTIDNASRPQPRYDPSLPKLGMNYALNTFRPSDLLYGSNDKFKVGAMRLSNMFT